MRFYRIGMVLILAMVLPVSAVMAGELESKEDKISYSIGFDIGSNFKKQEIEIDPDVFKKGIEDAIGGKDPQLTSEQMVEVLNSFRQEMMAKQQQKMSEVAENNKKEGETFLAENKKKKGVKTLPSGLQYKVITAGKGKKPTADDTVKTHYKGTLIDGTEFDSSHKRGQPAEFPVKGVIKGWTEALQLMPIGSKWELYVPSDLAYGQQGAG
ncbi:MAG TPA: FKBP-type peptidyl-prolyl cis-trans isomerase, partial [Nitrospiria bacterium]